MSKLIKQKVKPITTKEVKENILSVSDVAKSLGLQPRSVRKYFEDGLLKGQKVGNEWFTTKHDLKNFNQPHYRGGRPAKTSKTTK